MTVQLAPPPSAEAHDPRDGAVLGRAARLAQRLLRRACCRSTPSAGCHSPGRRDSGRGRQGAAGPRTTARPGTMPPCRSPSACSSPTASRCRASLFAAMAQQDCGQCGYLCETYSKAIADGNGDQAQPVRPRRQGHEPHAEAAAGGDASAGRRHRRRQGIAPTPVPARRAAEPGTRECPVEAIFRMAPPASTARARRRTRATSCSTSPTAASPMRPATASASIPGTTRRWPRRSAPPCACRHDFPVGGKPIRDALIEDYALGVAPDMPCSS